MDALADAIKANFTQAQCAEIAAMLEASIGKQASANTDARALTAQVWDKLPETLRERCLNYGQRVYALTGEPYADFLAELGAPKDTQ
ncbi:MAG: hypothetical protein B6D41_11850 [Chloroflexi bacterium UTCFX4]|nr:MAG: hypothetical protein B6D41_11850 [Chloroflexi bacterium UTCFX4]